ncbi:MAG TPA: excinuclease ABC subunit UvrC [Candidatus Eisenbacteria bacterium]|nr:excinuclease ABC subunit UvrC [Candidatus Eisenbacteria bacterium]
MSALSDKVHNLPAVPGVYLFKGAAGEILYVGKAKSLSQRVRSYLTGESDEPRLRELMALARDLDTILTDTEVEALLLEATLIRQHKPRYNVLLKDDKSFPYVRVSVQEAVPRLSITRQVKDDGARYLGPYTDVKALRRTLREIRRVFPVRTCRNFEDYRRTNRPCLYFHIRRCVGPCTTRSRATPEEYRRIVDGLLLYLTGRDDDLLHRLQREMAEAATERRYEDAARRRDQIRLLEKARVPQKVVSLTARDADALGVARHGDRAAVVALVLRGGRVVGKEVRLLDRAQSLDRAETLRWFVELHYVARGQAPPRLVLPEPPAGAEVLAQALEQVAGRPVTLAVPNRGREARLVAVAGRNAALTLEDLSARAAGRRAHFTPEILELQQALDLPVPPYRMVCFDISNLGAEGAVAAVVASENGRARRGLYRRMRMRRPGPDDFSMIREAVERYWTRVESGEEPRPDLVVIDGGAGQVTAARAALAAVATRPVPLIGLAKREETVVRERSGPVRLPRRSPALRALQRLRDEAHRFGLTYHRTLRGRSRLASALDEIPGIGATRRAALLKAFGSVDGMLGADVDTLVARARIPRPVAERVVAHLAGRGGAPGADVAEGAAPDAEATDARPRDAHDGDADAGDPGDALERPA